MAVVMNFSVSSYVLTRRGGRNTAAGNDIPYRGVIQLHNEDYRPPMEGSDEPVRIRRVRVLFAAHGVVENVLPGPSYAARTGLITVWAPASEWFDWVDLLRNEAPIHANVSHDPESGQVWFGLSTHREDVGEGE